MSGAGSIDAILQQIVALDQQYAQQHPQWAALPVETRMQLLIQQQASLPAATTPASAAPAPDPHRVSITPEMSKTMSPKSVIPEDEGGTESRGVDPMKLRPNNDQLEATEAMRDRVTKKYGSGDDDS